MFVYADNASTTPINPDALNCIVSAYTRYYGNPSSTHKCGKEAWVALQNARTNIAKALGVHGDEIIFTSGGTESNNIVLQSYLKKNNASKIIISSIEHKSVLECVKYCSKKPDDIMTLPVDREGVVLTSHLHDNLSCRDVSLVSIMTVNNEIGTVQPISDIAKLCHEHGVLLHTDAVQAVTLSSIREIINCADYISLSGHKFHGPKGVGLLIAKNNTTLDPIFYGGGQERGLRPGTENTVAAIGIAYAICDSVEHMYDSEKHLRILNQITIEGLLKIEGAKINGIRADRIPNIISVSFDGVDGVALVQLLSNEGIMVSTGSACNSSNNNPSHVLSAIGLPERESMGTIRISYSRYNTEQEARYLIEKVIDCVSYIRKITPCP